jgi:rubrerythrin
MRFRQISEVLDWTRAFHDTLANDYDGLAKGHEKERVGMLLQYLAEHERALSAAIEHYQEDAVSAVLDTWYDQAPEVKLPPDLNSLCNTLEKVDTETVLSLALMFHDVLIDMYSVLASKAPSQGAKALFDSLISQETREKMRTVRDAMRLEDL